MTRVLLSSSECGYEYGLVISHTHCKLKLMTKTWGRFSASIYIAHEVEIISYLLKELNETSTIKTSTYGAGLKCLKTSPGSHSNYFSMFHLVH